MKVAATAARPILLPMAIPASTSTGGIPSDRQVARSRSIDRRRHPQTRRANSASGLTTISA